MTRRLPWLSLCPLALAVGLALAVPLAKASPRTPPTLEEFVISNDLIVIATVAKPPAHSSAWYSVTPELVLKGQAPKGPLRVQAQSAFSCLMVEDETKHPAPDADAKRVLLFLKATKDGKGYWTDGHRTLAATKGPEKALQFGFAKARPYNEVLAAIRALVELHRPGLETSHAALLWLRGLRSDNTCLVACMVARTGGHVSYGPPRERITAQRVSLGATLPQELRSLLAHTDAEIRAQAALYLKGIVDGLADKKASAAERTPLIVDLRRNLDDKDVTVRARTLSALAELGDGTVRPRILKLLKDPNATTEEREAALWSVGYLTRVDPKQKGQDLVAAVLGLLDDKRLAGYAVAVLRRLTGAQERKSVAAWKAYAKSLEAGR